MRIRQLAAALGAMLLLTACGGSPLDGKAGSEVATAAADALEKAGAVRMAGTVDQDGEEGAVDLRLQGDDASGTITLGGVEIQLLSVDGAAYLQAPPDFWATFGMPEEAAATFEGRWVTVPSEAMSNFSDFSLNAIVEELRNPSSDVQDEATSDERDGEGVVVVEREDGSTLVVADDDPAYPLEMTSEGDSAGTMTFSGFGEKEDIAAPDDALDLAELMGG